MAHLWSSSSTAFLASVALATAAAQAEPYRLLDGSEYHVGCVVCDSISVPLTGTFDLTVTDDFLPVAITFDLTSIQFDAAGQSITGTGAYSVAYATGSPITQEMEMILSVDGQSPITLAVADGGLPDLVDDDPTLPRIDLVLNQTDPDPRTQGPTDPIVSLRLVAAPVPEPATLGLLAAGLALTCRRRSRMKRG